MKDDVLSEILDRLEMRDLWNLDTMRYSVTLDEAALACVGITPLNNEGEEDQVITCGELFNSWLQITIENVNEVSPDQFEEDLLTLKKDMLLVREIYIDMREDLKAKENEVDKILELDQFKTTEKGRPYVTRTSVHAWAAKYLQKNLVGWQIKQTDNQIKSVELVDVQPNRAPPIVSAKNQTLVIGALTQLWLTAIGAPSGITKSDNEKPNASVMAEKVENLLNGMDVKTLRANTIRQVISPCITAFNKNEGIDSKEFIDCIKDGLQRIEDESPIKQ
jgi:hypothetical protein